MTDVSLLESIPTSSLTSNALLALFFTQPREEGPRYLAILLQHLQLHVNFLYQDPLRLLITSIRSVLEQVKPQPDSCSVTTPFDLVHTDVVLLDSTPTPHYLPSDRALTRPAELASRTDDSQDDVLLLAPSTLELFLRNSYAFLDVLIEYGLGEERLEYLTVKEEEDYIAPLLEYVVTTDNARLRRFALHFTFQLVPLGIDLYCNTFYLTYHRLVKEGSFKVTGETEAFGENNFNAVTDLLSEWLSAGFDVNYNYTPPLLFPDEYGVVTKDDSNSRRLTTVQYRECSVLALAVIYNRADVVSWLLEFCGVLRGQEELYARVLDLGNPVIAVDDEQLLDEQAYDVIALTWSSYPTACESNLRAPQEKTQSWTISQLADRHASEECGQLLRAYDARTAKEWSFDPLVHDLRAVAYHR